MKRTILQIYVKNSWAAAVMYEEAFQTKIRARIKNLDGTYLRCELDLGGQVMMLSEIEEDHCYTGNAMQFTLEYEKDEREKLEHAYDVMKKGAKILHPLTPTRYCKLLCDFIDRYGIRWCLFIH